MRVAAQQFDAQYVDLRSTQGSAAQVAAIWCALNGRLRRFTADNVNELQEAGHDFYVRDASGATHGIYVIGASPRAHLHTNATGVDRNALLELPDWGLLGRSAGHSTRPPPTDR
jgi:hypothetical protein